MKLEFFLTDFQKIFIKFDTFTFNENPPSGSWVVADRQTDRWMARQTWQSS